MSADIKLIHGDCMDLMHNTPDKFYDLAIVDPPYGIVSQQKRGIGSRIDPSGKMNSWNYNKPSQQYFNELFRVSKQCIIWGANNFILPESEYFIVWDKQQTVDNFASAEYAWTNCKMPAKVFRFSVHKMMHEQDKIHPTQKPVRLYHWILNQYAKNGEKILDTHLGSGSIAIACHDMSFDLTATEIDKDYYDAAVNRLENHKKQGQLFI